ncbi:lysophospholipase [Malassezia vespertilionis]|uniref:Acyl-protein thioesterase 1 n=1 Tax=Malassezia vespertilionis TaxID=2020962 RepID=A0A2N1J9F8_9BASI|nr:lysophospholipase [Malassezia vespertilionis]PKI83189.1 hypothetical protein MVES_002937 [Malassezia vespertilionis]WFD07725.1 lysophospholipase [Malassezia vespertilionis]
MAAALKTLIVPPVGGGMPSATVFLLHGLGDTAQGWMDVARMLGQNQALQHVRFVLPTAPVQPVTVNMGMKMTSWFDLYSLTSMDEGEDEAGLMKSTEAIRGLVQEEINGTASQLNGHKVPSSRIVVAGFSQGGAISLLTGLTSPAKLAGVGALSTWLPMYAKVPAMRTQSDFPIFQAHGTSDQIVDFKFGESTHKHLANDLGFNKLAEFFPYEGMQHSASPQEIIDFGKWLERVLPI